MSVADEAAAWLNGIKRKISGSAMDASGLETQAIRDAIAGSPGMDDLIGKWAGIAVNPDSLAQDIGLVFYQSKPTLRKADELAAPERLNRAIAAAIMSHPDIESLRQHTTYDRWAALMAVQSMSEQIWQVLKEQAAKAASDAKLEQQLREQQENLRRVLSDDNATDQEVAEALASAQAAKESLEKNGQFNDKDAQAVAVLAIRHAIGEVRKELEETEEQIQAWGHSEGQMQMMSMQERLDLMKEINGNRMGRFAELIGRFRITAHAEQARKVEYGRTEPYTVRLGNQIDEVIGSELVKLAHPKLRLDMIRRLGERQLIQRHWRGEERAARGPMIVLIDTSGSMRLNMQGHEAASNEPTREAWAKAVALALADVCAKQGRKFTAVLFATAGRTEVVDVPIASGPERTAALLRMGNVFFGGGTSFEGPLTLVQEKIAPTEPNADVVLITDGICSVSDLFQEQWREYRNGSGLRVFGIVIGAGVTRGLKAVSTNTRSITDLLDPSTVSDLYQSI